MRIEGLVVACIVALIVSTLFGLAMGLRFRPSRIWKHGQQKVWLAVLALAFAFTFSSVWFGQRQLLIEGLLASTVTAVLSGLFRLRRAPSLAQAAFGVVLVFLILLIGCELFLGARLRSVRDAPMHFERK